MRTFTDDFLKECGRITSALSVPAIECLADTLAAIRNGVPPGRLFVLGNGGGLGTASHAAADFRCLTGIQALAPESPAELTALANDYGFDETFAIWLARHHPGSQDGLMVLSVGGGHRDGPSANIVRAAEYAVQIGMPVFSIVGRTDGFAFQCSTPGLALPDFVAQDWITPHAEWVQSMVLHLLVSHPRLKIQNPVWEQRHANPT